MSSPIFEATGYEQREVDRFQLSRLLALDFDNTIALTEESGPSGMTVSKAYEQAFSLVGGPAMVELFINMGGHGNNAPAEIVSGLVSEDSPSELRQEITERIVEAKLNVLLDQVGQGLEDGSPWPRLTPGFADFWQRPGSTNSESPIHTAIISSGHETFIRKTFDVHKLRQPDILVSDDDIRPLEHSRGHSRLFKPGTYPFALAHRRWLELYGLTGGNYNHSAATEAKKRVLYVGDDLVKDGGLAKNSGIRFIHLDKGQAAACWRQAQATLHQLELATGRPADE